MKTNIILAVLALTGAAAQAEVYTCGFTEPFYTITYDTDSKVLTVKNDVEAQVEEMTDVAVSGDAYSFVKTLSKDGQTLMTITLTGKGSDGMSNTIYPFEAK